MWKFALMLLFASLPASATAEKILYCTDVAVAGFESRDNKLIKNKITPSRFTVKVLNETQRLVKFPNRENAFSLNCTRIGDGRLECQTLSYALPFYFKNDRYERGKLFSGYVGGGGDLSVAYGTCMNF